MKIKNLSMKKYVLMSAIAFLGTFTFLGCKKSSVKPTNNLTGYWLGAFNNGGKQGNEGELFKSDGTTVQYDFYGVTTTDTTQCPYIGYGTYTVNGNTMTMQVTFPTLGNEMFSYQLSVNTSASPNTISGSFTSSNGGGAGTLNLVKQ